MKPIKKQKNNPSPVISRKEAIEKAGKFAVFAAATIIFLSPKSAQAQSKTSQPSRRGDRY